MRFCAIVAPDPLMKRASRLGHGLGTAVSGFRQFVTEGGLISYGPDTGDIVRRSASYVDRILRGDSRPTFRCRRRSSTN